MDVIAVTFNCDDVPSVERRTLRSYSRDNNMTNNSRETLQLLKRELEFLDAGGYQRCPHSPWRAGYLFEESPSCPNDGDKARPHECKDCWLMQFVAPELRDEQVPCRFVQLGHGITVDSLYRCGTLAESEEVLRHWLRERIRELEQQLSAAQNWRSDNCAALSANGRSA